MTVPGTCSHSYVSFSAQPCFVNLQEQISRMRPWSQGLTPLGGRARVFNLVGIFLEHPRGRPWALGQDRPAGKSALPPAVLRWTADSPQQMATGPGEQRGGRSAGLASTWTPTSARGSRRRAELQQPVFADRFLVLLAPPPRLLHSAACQGMSGVAPCSPQLLPQPRT